MISDHVGDNLRPNTTPPGKRHNRPETRDNRPEKGTTGQTKAQQARK